LLTALLLPWLLGYVWMRVLWTHHKQPSNSAHLLPFQLGYGYILGILGTTLIMRAWHELGFQQDFFNLAAIHFILVAIGLLAIYQRTRHLPEPITGEEEQGASHLLPSTEFQNEEDAKRFEINPGPGVAGSPALPSWQRIALILILALITSHLVINGLGIIWRPLYAWDAWATWAHKTRVWFELRELVAFVPPEQWLKIYDTKVYTTLASSYPSTIPLIQVWTLLGLGHWDDALMNLPWLFCALGLGLALYGQARLWGLAMLPALIAVYFLLSLPILNAHVELAGNADLWVAATYGLAVMALLQWIRNRDSRQLLLALLAAVAVTQIKQEGIAWALILVPLTLPLLLPKHWLYSLILLLIAIIGALFLTGGITMEIPGVGHLSITAEKVVIPNIREFRLGYYPEAGEHIIKNMYTWDNWHLLWYLAPFILWNGLPHLAADKALLVSYILLAATGGFVALVFLFTHVSQWAIDATLINRIILQLAPAVLFILLTACHTTLCPSSQARN